MKYLFAGTGIIAAVAFAALTWGPLRQAPMPPSPSHEASTIEPTVSTPEPRSPDAQQMPSRAELGDQPTAAHQGSTEPAPPIQRHRRKRRADSKESAQLDRSVANGFTADLNRQELQSLRSGVIPQDAPWRGLYPSR
jgi:hypothetical protein